MRTDKFVQNGNGVQVLGIYVVALGVFAIAPDLTVVPHQKLISKAIFYHVGIVIHVVKGENQGLFPLRYFQFIADHHRLAGCVRGFGPDLINVHQNKALVIDALKDLIVFVHRDHPVVDAVGHIVTVEGQLRVSYHRMEKQMLHGAGPIHPFNRIFVKG